MKNMFYFLICTLFIMFAQTNAVVKPVEKSLWASLRVNGKLFTIYPNFSKQHAALGFFSLYQVKRDNELRFYDSQNNHLLIENIEYVHKKDIESLIKSVQKRLMALPNIDFVDVVSYQGSNRHYFEFQMIYTQEMTECIMQIPFKGTIQKNDLLPQVVINACASCVNNPEVLTTIRIRNVTYITESLWQKMKRRMVTSDFC